LAVSSHVTFLAFFGAGFYAWYPPRPIARRMAESIRRTCDPAHTMIVPELLAPALPAPRLTHELQSPAISAKFPAYAPLARQQPAPPAGLWAFT